MCPASNTSKLLIGGWLGMSEETMDIWDGRTPFVVLAAAFLASFWVAILVHEIGHFLFGRLARIPIRLVWVGSGPLLLRLSLIGTPVELRAVPLGGAVSAYPAPLERKFAEMFFIIGGIAGNLAFIAFAGFSYSLIHGPLLPPDIEDMLSYPQFI